MKRRKYRTAILGICLAAVAYLAMIPLNIIHDSHITSQLNPIKVYAVDDFQDSYDFLAATISASLAKEASLSTNIYRLYIDEQTPYFMNSLEDVSEALAIVAASCLVEPLTFQVDYRTKDSLLIPEIAIDTPAKAQATLNDLSITGSTNEDASSSRSTDYSEEIIPVELNKQEDSLSTHLSFTKTLIVEAVPYVHQPLSTPSMVASELLESNPSPETYKVTSGDSPSSIARENDMTLDALYDLNDGLRSRSTSLKVGDDVIIEKLIPELSVKVISEDTYTEVFNNKTLYEEDDTLYKGLEKVFDPGYNGLLEITDQVESVEGQEICRTRLSVKIISQAQPTIIHIGSKAIPATGSVGFFVKPLSHYTLTSYFGARWGRAHNGLDMATPSGTAVKAADGGSVTVSKWNDGYGYLIEVDHGNGMITRYAHNSQLLVAVGDEVGQGQIIAKSGNTGNSTGPHLHFELMVDGKYVNPIGYFKDL